MLIMATVCLISVRVWTGALLLRPSTRLRKLCREGRSGSFDSSRFSLVLALRYCEFASAGLDTFHVPAFYALSESCTIARSLSIHLHRVQHLPYLPYIYTCIYATQVD